MEGRSSDTNVVLIGLDVFDAGENSGDLTLEISRTIA